MLLCHSTRHGRHHLHRHHLCHCLLLEQVNRNDYGIFPCHLLDLLDYVIILKTTHPNDSA